jgi:putative membrane protein
MKKLLIAVSALGLMAGCAPTATDTTAASAVDPMSPLGAPGFMAMAASSDQFEIQSSQMALQMSQNPQVRSFAQMMIDHHTRTTAELTTIAQANGMTPPPPTLMPNHQAMLSRIQAAGPGQFDAAYKQEQIMSHQEALTLMQNYASGGDTPALRDFATRTSPVIQQHLTQAQTLPDMMMAPQPMQQQPVPATTRAGERG